MLSPQPPAAAEAEEAAEAAAPPPARPPITCHGVFNTKVKASIDHLTICLMHISRIENEQQNTYRTPERPNAHRFPETT
jgi:hypothetical protein